MSGSEFQLIQSYFSDPKQVQRSDVILGIGDDCAIVAPQAQRQLAFSIDTLISAVHFPKNTSATAIAYKSLAVNLSDLAAMGAKPAWFTLSLTLPNDDEQWLKAFSQSLFSLATKHNIQLIGGDTTHGSLAITIQVCGYLEHDKALKRSAAKVGDLIVVTGELGAASIGLDLVLGNNSQQHKGLSQIVQQQAIDALNYPQARINDGAYLTDFAHAAVDLSDGLLSDLGHILTASHVGATIALEQLPLAKSVLHLSKEQAWDRALTGGDDYELCFTLTKKDWATIKQQLPHCVVIGEITSTKGLHLMQENGQEYKIRATAYDHFR